ncbi:MAG: AI-2E family transporter, partial [Deltaproteobacteria bacterium]|nr:AI-2E family transporter [Deltaproteobacteria bacterium]
MLRVNIGLNRTLVGLLGAAIVLWLLFSLRTVVLELLIALGIAYILDPLVDRLERLVRSRGVAILLLLIPLLGVIALVFAWLVPRLVEEIRTFVQGLPDMLEVPFLWLRDQLSVRFNVAIPATLEEL